MINRVKTGDRAEIGFKDTEGKGGANSRRRLSTVVEAVLPNREVLILMPISAGTMVRLPMKKEFEARFYSESSVYVFDVTILDHPIIDGQYLTKLRLNSAGERVQLRDFYRINSAIEFNFSIAKDQLNEDGELTLHKAITKDLSGGGMSFVSDASLEDKTEIYANFVLDGEYIVVLGRAMGRQEAKGLYRYQYRCQFLAMPDMDQEKVVQFINNQQYKSIWQTREDA